MTYSYLWHYRNYQINAYFLYITKENYASLNKPSRLKNDKARIEHGAKVLN